MSQPILELIAQNVEETLRGVSTATGYHFDLKVERRKQWGNREDDSAAIISLRDWGRGQDDQDHITKVQEIVVTVFAQVSATDANTPIDQRVALLGADVERAMMQDVTRGGYADRTEPNSGEYFIVTDGTHEGMNVVFEVTYHHVWGDPYTKD